MAGEPRDTFKYKFRNRLGRIVHKGITNDLDRRESEHRQKWPGGQIEKVGNKTTRRAAREWERDEGV